jgi:hypothetical protein
MYITEVKENDEGELYVEIPDEVLDELEWKEDDCLSWSFKGESLILTKV